ncbi:MULTISPECIES: hypothetical protein [Anaeromyxobacter]|uniref:hypothetical protein n=1 Tax=Anaeromyxobacter TaxID=161492 RepID=UPI001F59CA18|nr:MULTISPECIES: hypothetical protein [unclassified Anaeromyxobacter]
MNTWSLVPMLLVDPAVPAEARRALHASLYLSDAARAREARVFAGRVLVERRRLSARDAAELVGVETGALEKSLPLAA